MANKLKEAPRDEWNFRNIQAMLYGSTALLLAGQYKEIALNYVPETVFGFRYLDSARHPLPAVAITLFTQWYSNTAIGEAPRPIRWIHPLRVAFQKLSGVILDYERTSAAVIGFIPSVGYELHQYYDGGRIGVGDLVLAGISGALAMKYSTSEAPPAPRYDFADPSLITNPDF